MKEKLLLLLLTCFSISLYGQNANRIGFLHPADSLNQWRFWGSAAAGATIYTSTMIALNEIWYADFERSSFQFFNDSKEWRGMDKAGHAVTAYNEALWVYKGLKWTGLEERKSIWMGVAMGTLFQSSVEVLDGYSAKWGFSVPDVAFNTLGVSLFAVQQLAWEEQRILLKVSSFQRPYPDRIITAIENDGFVLLSTRAADLYGTKFGERFFKDYNAMTNWASINVHSFIKNENTKIPRWLNVAVGYGADNLYGGFENRWEEGELTFDVGDIYQRNNQFYLSLDIDLTRIRTKSRFLKTLFSIVNVIKIPAPALEVNTLGKVKLHAIYF